MLNNPSYCTYSSELSKLFVADTKNNRIQQFAETPTGARLFDSNAITVAGDIDKDPGADLEHLKFPNCLAVLGNRNLAVGDPQNNRILITDLD